MTPQEALAAALQDAYDAFDDHKRRHPGHQGTCQSDWPDSDTLAHAAAPRLTEAGYSIVPIAEVERLNDADLLTLPCGYRFTHGARCGAGPDHAVHGDRWHGLEPQHVYQPEERRKAERRAGYSAECDMTTAYMVGYEKGRDVGRGLDVDAQMAMEDAAAFLDRVATDTGYVGARAWAVALRALREPRP